MTYKQIEASRETRLWIGQVIVPIIIGAVAIYSNDKARYAIKNKFEEVKRSIKIKKN